MDINTTVKLNNGIRMPILGLGVWQMSNGRETVDAIKNALQLGYRLIDTAKIYGNEDSVGKAIRESGIPRSKIFVTTKIWNSDHGNPEKAFDDSLKRLGLDYVDLYLIHWPVRERNETWKVFEELLASGRTKSIGVSNFTVRHLKELLNIAGSVPAVNQVEFHPYNYDEDLLEFCKSKGIQLEAYSPLVRGKKFDDPKLVAIARNYRKSPAQVLLRWGLQHGLIEIPKSSSPKRQKENADIFDFKISQTDMKELDSFTEDFRVVAKGFWDPDDAT